MFLIGTALMLEEIHIFLYFFVPVEKTGLHRLLQNSLSSKAQDTPILTNIDSAVWKIGMMRSLLIFTNQHLKRSKSWVFNLVKVLPCCHR